MVRFQTLDRYSGDAMATTAQILANRQNSLSSTGPITIAGKAASSQSAVSHGLSASNPVLPYEDLNAFLALVDAYRTDFAPETAQQEFLVREMAGAQWKLQRATRIENLVLTGMLDSSNEPVAGERKIAQAMMTKDGDALLRLERHRAALERTYHRCAREIRASQKMQNEANSQQLAEKKYADLMTKYIFGPLPDEAPATPAPKAAPAAESIKPQPPAAVKPGPCIPRDREEWKRNGEYAMTNPALRL